MPPPAPPPASAAPLAGARPQYPPSHCAQMRYTAHVVLPVPERPNRMSADGGDGALVMMACSIGETLNGKSTAASSMPRNTDCRMAGVNE
eukprot:352265-Chlamydomonas_euryale.AAC.1